MREVEGVMVLHGKKRGCENMEIAKGSSVYIEGVLSEDPGFITYLLTIKLFIV